MTLEVRGVAPTRMGIEIRAAGLKKADVEAYAKVRGIRVDQAAGALIHLGLDPRQIDHARGLATVRGTHGWRPERSRRDAAIAVLSEHLTRL